MGGIAEGLLARFGIARVQGGLFHAFPHALRFDLGGEGPRRVRLVRAERRARAIASALLGRTARIEALLTVHDYGPHSAHHARRCDRRMVRALQAWDLRARPRAIETMRYPDPEEPASAWSFARCAVLCLRPGNPAIARLLRISVATDYLGGRPHAGVAVHLVDARRRVMLHAYDDRGMDVVAMHPGRLRPAYRHFNAWLLDYDRTRMDAAFGAR